MSTHELLNKAETLEFIQQNNNDNPLSNAWLEVAMQPVQKNISSANFTGGLRLADITILYLCGTLALTSQTNSVVKLALILVISVSISQLAYRWNLYNIGFIRSYIRKPLMMMGAIALIFSLCYAVIGFSGQMTYPLHKFFQKWLMLSLAALFFVRQVAQTMVRYWYKTGALQKRTVIVGGGANAAALIDTLNKQPMQELNILGIFDDRIDARSPDMVMGYKKLGNIDDLIEFARLTRVDLAICTIPMTAETRVLKMMRKLWVLPIDIRLSAHTSQLKFASRSYSNIGAAAFIDVCDKPMKDSDMLIKSLFDRVVGALMLIALSPLMLITAIAIKLDSKGPVFFKQKRHGFNNETIDVWKFRSMRTDMLDHGGLKQVSKIDPRVTKVGRFIRKTSIDELPQLFNVVFFGNLSLVGPRPHSVAQKFFEEVVDGYFARHKVKPGITGWAQINGWRGETDTDEKMQKRVEFDLHYTENWSISFDIMILLKTPYALFSQRENAY